ncbi:MAG TPA: DUF5996 family protein [Polyangiaceae bacterium]|nr:DUF5996 family protein [Polyangiaceae bacterium]
MDTRVWPNLEAPSAAATSSMLQLLSQIVGKTTLALAPMVNHWWQVTLRVSARGLTTGAIPYGTGEFDVEFDLIAHEVVIRTSAGTSERIPLASGTVAAFHQHYFSALRRLGIEVTIRPLAVEIPETIWLDSDTTHREYDPDWANRFLLALQAAERAFSEFRGGFLGKVSPVQFFWGSFDLAVTRFSGRAAPTHPGGAPHCPDYVMIEAYSQEVSSAGFWAGDARFPEPAFYSYAYPEPEGFRSARVEPDDARYLQALGEFVLPYAAVRSARSPQREVLAFLNTTYEAAAELAGWDRATLEIAKVASAPKPVEEAHDRNLRTSQPGRRAPARRGAEQ